MIASLICDNGSVTDLNLSDNLIKDEGVTAICEAVQSNKETKLVSLNVGKNSMGPAGAKSVAAMVAVIPSVSCQSSVDEPTLHGLKQYYVKLAENEKNRKLNELLDALEFNQVVVFVESAHRAIQLDKLLQESNFPSVAIHASMKQVCDALPPPLM